MLITNCRLLDRKDLVDILIEDEKIKEIGNNIKKQGNMEIIDGKGNYLLPGMIDVHTHMREPGLTYKEDIENGSLACAKGGITTFIDMPNTIPVTTTTKALEEKRSLYKEKSHVNFGFNFGGSLDNNSKEIKDAKGIVATKVFLNESTGKMLIEDDKVLEDIFNASENIMVHAEGKMVQKAIDLAIKTKKKLYLCHISQKMELDIIRKAKEEYKDIYAEVTPHHLFLDVSMQTNRLRMKPELKPKEDVLALWEGILDGTIDTIGTDHAPHTLEEKDSKVTFGIPGIETAMPLLLTAVNEGKLSLSKVVELYSSNPQKIFNIGKKAQIKKGYDADLILVDMKKEYVLKNEEIVSKCRWTPFEGQKIMGRIEKTIVNGNLVFDIESESKFNKIIGREVIING